MKGDLRQLEAMEAAALVQKRKVEDEAASFLEESRDQEGEKRQLNVMHMLWRREEFGRLEQQIKLKSDELSQVEQQRDRAQQGLESSYRELRALELLAERRLNAAQQEANRLAYKSADDSEILRLASREVSDVEN